MDGTCPLCTGEGGGAPRARRLAGSRAAPRCRACRAPRSTSRPRSAPRPARRPAPAPATTQRAPPASARRTAAAGTYALEVTNGLPGARTNITHDLVPLSITLRDAAPWPTKRFHIAAGSSVQTITDALAAAAAAGGGVVALAAGTWDMKNTSLRLAHNVQLTWPEDAPTAALLHWTEPTTASLLSNANSSAKTRYAVRDLSIYVGAAAAGYVLDIGGHGVEIR